MSWELQLCWFLDSKTLENPLTDDGSCNAVNIGSENECGVDPKAGVSPRVNTDC